MANINVTFTENTITVDENLTNVTVTSSTSNVVVTEGGIASAEEVRAALSAVSPILYNTSSGVFSFDSNASFAGKTTDDLAQGTNNRYWSTTGNAVTTTFLTEGANLYFTNARVLSAITGGNVKLKQFSETVVNNGNLSGNVTFNLANGTLHTGTLVGNITAINFTGITAGSSATLILQQDNVGGSILNTSTFPLAWADWDFVSNQSNLTIAANAVNYLSVMYDGTTYHASLLNSSGDTVTFNGVTIPVGGSGNITTGNIAESGSTNLYFSNTRARAAVSSSDAGGLGSFAYDSGTGVFTYTGPSDLDVRSLVSVNDTGGFGSLSYSSSNGVITYVGPTTSDVRTLISATAPITYNNLTGVVAIQSSPTFAGTTTVSGLNPTSNSLITVVNAPSANITYGGSLGTGDGAINYTGNILMLYSPNSATDALYYTYTGNTYHRATGGSATNSQVDGFTIVNAPSVATTGAYTLGSSTNNASFTYNTGTNTVSINKNVSVTGNVVASANVTGTYFIGNGSLLTGVTSLTNAQVLAYIATQPLSVGGNLDVTGNINATGNINYQNVTDLYVTDQKITLNSNAATNANVEIISNRPTATNTMLKWNEQATRWEFTNNGTTYYPIPTSTTDLAEGSNLWFTTARANSAIDSRLIGGTGISYSSGTIALDFAEFDTGNIVEGSNLWFTTGRANSAIDARVNKAFVEGLGISYTSLTDKPVIPTHTSNLINDSGFITVANANVISVNGQTGVVSLTTTDIAEGANLYFTTDRANTAIGAYQGTINTAGNITTSANVSGQYILGNGAFLTGIASPYGDSNVTTLLANLGSNVISSTANIGTTADINVTGNVYGNIVASQINHPQPFGAILMNSIFVDELAIGRNPSNRIFISGYGGETVSQGQYLRITNTSPQTATFSNFGLSFSNIGTFGNVSAGDPANISYSQDTASVVRAGLSGDVGDITVTGVGTGDTGWVVINQDVTGGRTLTLGSAWKMEGCTTGNPVNIALGPNEESLIFWTYDGTYYRGTVTPNIGSNVSVDIKTTGNIVGGNANITNAVNAATVNATNVNGTTVTATTANAATVNSTTVNATTVVATTANATTVNGTTVNGTTVNATTVNGTTVNANTIATTAVSNTVNINANVTSAGNIVANASVVTVTNGSNFIPYAERNLGLTIDRNNNTANASASVVTGSSIAYRGGFSPDRIVFSGMIDGYFDGQPVTISGFTDATLAGALNGNVYYLRMRGAAPGTYDIYSDAAMTTAVNLAVGNLTGTQTGPGTITFTRRNSVTAKEWALNLDQVSNDLRIKEDGTTRVTVASGGNLNISGTANANAVVISQPGTAGTYANTEPVDSTAGILSGGAFNDLPNVSNVFVSIAASGQTFPVGSPFQLTFTGVTGPGNININGQTFYSNGFDYFADGTGVQLFLDSATTTPANAVVIGILPGTGAPLGTGGGNVSFTFTAGSTGNNWQLSNSVNGNLDIAHNGTVKGNIDTNGNFTITGRHTYDRVYGEFFSNVTQTANAANTPTAITLNNTGIGSDVSIVDNSNITIAKPGNYNLQFSLQLTNADNSNEHDFDVWLRKNGTNVPNTNTQYTVVRGRSGADGKNVAALNLFLDAAAGDVYQIMFAVTDTQVSVEAIAELTTPYARPATPSAIVTVAPIGA